MPGPAQRAHTRRHQPGDTSVKHGHCWCLVVLGAPRCEGWLLFRLQETG
jgi:hypothetical protein